MILIEYFNPSYDGKWKPDVLAAAYVVNEGSGNIIRITAAPEGNE